MRYFTFKKTRLPSFLNTQGGGSCGHSSPGPEQLHTHTHTHPRHGAPCANLPGSPSVFESCMLLARPLRALELGVRPTQWTPDIQSGEGWATACPGDAHASSTWLPSVRLSVCLSVWQEATLSSPALRSDCSERDEEAAAKARLSRRSPHRSRESRGSREPVRTLVPPPIRATGGVLTTSLAQAHAVAPGPWRRLR